MKNILITGASGFIGGALSRMLLARGFNVSGVSRTPRASKPGEVQWITWNDLDRVLPEQHAIVNLAGENVFGGLWTDAAKKRILESRVQGTRMLAGRLLTDPGNVKILISASAVGYYGDTGSNWVAEDAAKGSGFLADVCAAWEAEARVASKAVIVSIPRIGVVLEKDGGALAKMIPQFKFFLGGPAGGDQYVPWIHRADMLHAILNALEAPMSGVWNATAPAPVTMSELADALGKALHRPSVFRAPAFVLKAVLGEASTALLGSQRVRPERLLQRKFTFQFPEIGAALADIVSRL
jgi:uncharacterized protein (TIGR01777 family)